MNSSESSQSSGHPEAEQARGQSPWSAADLDESCQMPVLYLFVSAGFWLVISSIFGLLATLKLHAPGLLADIPWFTYGRVWPVFWNALVYGFAVPGGIGVSLWLLARLTRQCLVLPWMIFMGALFWNVGILIGLLGILSGLTTGHAWLEMPHYTNVILFVCYAFMAIPAVMTFVWRNEEDPYPSIWFLFLALFWFPWAYAGACYLLNFVGLRGVMQAVADWWYIHNLGTIYFGLIGLAVLFYFAAKVAERPLYSRYQVMLILWLLALFGSWGDVPHGAPVPAWLPNLSAVTNLFVILVLLVLANVLHRTVSGHYGSFLKSVPYRFVLFGGVAFFVAGIVDFVTAIKPVSTIVELTEFTQAQSLLRVYGFFAMTLFGALYFIVPRLARMEWPFPRLISVHFWLAALGVVLYVVPLAISGIVQGGLLQQADVEFMQAVEPSLIYMRISTIGDVFFLLGHVVLFLNLGVLYYRYAFADWVATIVNSTQPTEAVEVGA